MKKGFKILFVFSILVGFNLAHISANPLENKTAVGVYGMGAMTNVDASTAGLEFEKWITPNFALGIIGSAFYNDSSYQDFSANVSLQFKYSMINSDFGDHFGSRFYAYAVAGYNGWSISKWDSDTYEYVATEYFNDVFVSLGFGIEWLLIDHLSLPLNFGFAGRFPENPTAGFCMGTGIRYSF